jgi:tetratricopeptide (TPR) repeat protein
MIGFQTMFRVAVFCLVAVWRVPAQTPNDSLQRYVLAGDQALADGRYADAEQAYEKVRQLAPGAAEVYAKLGVIYFQQGKFSQAVPVLTQALKLKPGLPNADTLLAMSLSELGRYGEALPGLEKAFRKSTDPALKRMSGLQLERTYTGLQRDAKAVEVALELNRLFPDDPEVLYHTARLSGNFAYMSMRKLADVAPESVWRKLAAGEVHESQEMYDAAITDYRQVLALDPRRPGIHFRIGRVMLARGRHTGSRDEAMAEALKEFGQELQIDPTNANAAYELAEIHRSLGQFSEAGAFFEKALQYYPDFEDALIGLGRTLLSLQKPEQALPRLNKAVALNPESDVGFYALAQAYRTLGNTAEQKKALAEFRRLREKHGTGEPGSSRPEVTKQSIDPAAAMDR